MAWQTEWEFKGEFLNVSKQSQIGSTAAAVDEVATARLLYLPLMLCTQRSAHPPRKDQKIYTRKIWPPSPPSATTISFPRRTNCLD